MNKRLPIALLILLIALPLCALNTTATAQFQQGQPVDEDDGGVDRVARLSFIEGDVSFLREGESEWAAAVANLPLFAGEQVYTGPGARAELQFAHGAFVRLAEKTALTITVLSDTTAQLEITEGTAIIHLEHLASAFDRFEVDTPGAALLLQKNGLYRINIGPNGGSEVIVRRGSLEASTADGTFKVRDGYRFIVGSDPGQLEIALDTSQDEWDTWTTDRHTTVYTTAMSVTPDYVTDHETNYNTFFGGCDLSSYGAWTNVPSYGQCWLPRVNSGWAPYRSGQWVFIRRIGWTWIANEPWGWAPYHYGRWAHLGRLGWAWVPGFRSGYHSTGYYRWRPALVDFFNCPTPRGQYIGWYPLSPGERWRRPHHNNSTGRTPSIRDRWGRPEVPGDLARGIRNPSRRHGVSLIPVDGFTRSSPAGRREGSLALDRTRPEPPDDQLRRWIDRRPTAGLPAITPGRNAMAPVTGSPEQARRPVVRPRPEAINRPIVVRNMPQPNGGNESAGNQGGDSDVRIVPRERRLVEPRQVRILPVPGSRRLDIEGGEAVRRSDRGNADHNESHDRPSGRESDARSGSRERSREEAGGDRRETPRGESTEVRIQPVLPNRDFERPRSDQTEQDSQPSRPRIRSGNREDRDNRGGEQESTERQRRRDEGSQNSNNEEVRSRLRVRPERDNSGQNDARPAPRDREQPREVRIHPRPEPGNSEERREVRIQPRPEPRSEERTAPRDQPRSEPRERPRAEPHNSNSQPRQEQPRVERPAAAPQPKHQPREERPNPGKPKNH